MNTWVTSENKRSLEQEGYTVIRRVFNKEEVTQIKLEFERHWLKFLMSGKIVQKVDKPMESLFPRFLDYHWENEVVKQFTIDARLFSIMESLLEEEALIIATNYYFKGPGMNGIPLHQDNTAIGVSPGSSCAAWISLDPSNEENGGLTFVPGSNELGLISPESSSDDVVDFFSDYGQQVRVPDGLSVIHVTSEPGDVVVFHGDVIHGSSDNKTTDRFRRALIVHFMKESAQRVTLNFNNLLNKKGEKVRRRLNTSPKIAEKQKSIFSFKEANYYETNGWK